MAPSFAAGVTSPQSITSADFNGDDKLDVAVASASGIAVLLGNGDGTFQTPVVTSSVGQTAIATADFNEDNIPDLVTTNPALGLVTIWLGKGDGTFQPPVTYPAGPSPVSVITADFRKNGKYDVAVVNQTNSGTVSILLGKGDGTFNPAKTFAVGSLPAALATGDTRSNGKFDLMVANSGSNNVSVLLGNGDGTFQPAVNYAVGAKPTSISTADFTAVQKVDLVVANSQGSSLSVLLGNNNGTFGTRHYHHGRSVADCCGCERLQRRRQPGRGCAQRL